MAGSSIIVGASVIQMLITSWQMRLIESMSSCQINHILNIRNRLEYEIMLTDWSENTVCEMWPIYVVKSTWIMPCREVAKEGEKGNHGSHIYT